MLKQVKYQEHEDPDQVYKVPVQPNFFDHFITILPRSVHSTGNIERNDQQEYHSRKYVETVETRDEEEKRTEGSGAKLFGLGLAF